MKFCYAQLVIQETKFVWSNHGLDCFAAKPLFKGHFQKKLLITPSWHDIASLIAWGRSDTVFRKYPLYNCYCISRLTLKDTFHVPGRQDFTLTLEDRFCHDPWSQVLPWPLKTRFYLWSPVLLCFLNITVTNIMSPIFPSRS